MATTPIPAPGSEPSTGHFDQPNARISSVAVERGLGAFLICRRGHNPLLATVTALALCCVPLGVVYLLDSLFGIVPIYLLAVGLVAIPLGIVYAVATLIQGFVSVYLYEGGFIRTRNGRLRVVIWPEVGELKVWRAPEKSGSTGGVHGYIVTTRDGKSVVIEEKWDDDERDEFGERLRRLVADSGGRVVDDDDNDHHHHHDDHDDGPEAAVPARNQ